MKKSRRPIDKEITLMTEKFDISRLNAGRRRRISLAAGLDPVSEEPITEEYVKSSFLRERSRPSKPLEVIPTKFNAIGLVTFCVRGVNWVEASEAECNRYFKN